LTLRAGTVTGLWGPNGCGKSTLLRALVGTATLLAGTIRRAPGVVLAYQEQHPRDQALLPVRGRELLRYAGARLDGLPTALRPALDPRIDRLSGGQYQLLRIWSALAGPARVILLDEPTNNLDPRATALLSAMLTQAREDARAVLLVSHERPFLEANATCRLDLA
jgi:zinc transport system ATP-binding protein